MRGVCLLLALAAGAGAFDPAAGGVECPSSGSPVHAWCEVVSVAAASCADVKAEVLARVDGQYESWHDPHNNGTYTLLASGGSGVIQLQRVTGNRKYVDKQTLELTDAAGGRCSISGCSVSQGFSMGDFSTNYCNLRMLTCGAAAGCKPVLHDFAVDETSVKKAPLAGADAKACITV